METERLGSWALEMMLGRGGTMTKTPLAREQ